MKPGKARKSLDLFRVAVFYDGYYFYLASNYYTYIHWRKSRLRIEGIHEYIRQYLAEAEGLDLKQVQIVDAHYFRGKLSAEEASARGDLLYSERLFEDVLMDSGITTHFLPIREVKGRMIEKGIDVWFALEVYENVRLNAYDYVVLVTGDGDFVPLVKKLNLAGVKTVLAYWNYEYAEEEGDRKIISQASQELIDWVYMPLCMSDVIDEDPHGKSQIINDLFVAPAKRQFASVREALGALPDKGERREGTILSLKTGYGFIKAPEINNVFFRYDALENVDFNDLQQGDLVEYTIEPAPDGSGRFIARRVRLIRN
jgi:uncharacterized LabA/DUF88 family protein/cold shock CspA family protein